MWLARDKYTNHLRLFKNKPLVNPDKNWEDLSSKITVDPTLYPQITFENSPVEMKLIPKEAYEDMKKIIRFFDKMRINNE